MSFDFSFCGRSFISGILFSYVMLGGSLWFLMFVPLLLIEFKIPYMPYIHFKYVRGLGWSVEKGLYKRNQ